MRIEIVAKTREQQLQGQVSFGVCEEYAQSVVTFQPHRLRQHGAFLQSPLHKTIEGNPLYRPILQEEDAVDCIGVRCNDPRRSAVVIPVVVRNDQSYDVIHVATQEKQGNPA